MPLHQRRIKIIEFSLDGTQFECQVRSWTINNNTDDGEVIYTQCPDGEGREDADPDFSLDLTFLADWRESGVSDFLWSNDGEEVDFVLDHHPDIPAEHVQWTGTVKLRAPNTGGEARATEETTVTLPLIGEPVYARVGA